MLVMRVYLSLQSKSGGSGCFYCKGFYNIYIYIQIIYLHLAAVCVFMDVYVSHFKCVCGVLGTFFDILRDCLSWTLVLYPQAQCALAWRGVQNPQGHYAALCFLSSGKMRV